LDSHEEGGISIFSYDEARLVDEVDKSIGALTNDLRARVYLEAVSFFVVFRLIGVSTAVLTSGASNFACSFNERRRKFAFDSSRRCP